MLGGRVLDVGPQTPVVVRANLIEVGRDVEAVGLSGRESLGQTEQAGTKSANALSVEDLGSDHGRSNRGDLDAELVAAHADLLELLGVRSSMLEDSEGVIGEGRRDLDEDSALDEGNKLGCELSALQT